MNSIRLHEKLGFKEEGRLRSMIFTNGKYYDKIYFGMTRDEFNSGFLSAVVSSIPLSEANK